MREVVALACVLMVPSAAWNAFAQPLPSATALAGPETPGGNGAEVDGAGKCRSTVAESEWEARGRCLDRLVKRVPTPLIQTPGAFFIGYAWGSKSRQFVYGPQVGVGAAVLFPLKRPYLTYEGTSSWDDEVAGRVFVLPENMSFTVDLALSLNANLAAFTFPNAESEGADDVDETEQGFNAGIYVAPQFGWVWWANGAQKRVALALGVLAGYLNTEATGAAFALGLQPALVAQF